MAAVINRLRTAADKAALLAGGSYWLFVEPDEDDLMEMRRILYGLHAILRLHFAQEEEGYLSLAEPGLERVIRSTYDLLGLISFLTAGEDECRAWTIRRGTPAPRAAGAVHADIEKGFIRAEVIAFADFVACRGEHGAKEHGKMRLEGKEYVVKDGDVMHFRFNV